MNIQKTTEFTFFGNNSPIKQSGDLQRIKDTVSVLQGKEITEIKIPDSAATLDISEEGASRAELLQQLRKAVQEMPDSGAIDYEEMMRMREILPKLQMDPAGSHYQEMLQIRQETMDGIKAAKQAYDLQDVAGAWMKAYALTYDKLAKSYDDGSRDVYISQGVDEDNKFIFHQVTEQEDVDYLNQAFARAAGAPGTLAEIQEQRWRIRHLFHGEEELGITLPENYGEKIAEMMEKARAEFVENYEAGAYKDSGSMVAGAISLGNKYLTEDEDFFKTMKRLFEGIKVEA